MARGGRKYYISNLIFSQRVGPYGVLGPVLGNLARAYAVTGESGYAVKVVVLLEAFAEVYDRLPLWGDGAGVMADYWAAGPDGKPLTRRQFDAARRDLWLEDDYPAWCRVHGWGPCRYAAGQYYEADFIARLADAYALVRNAPVVEAYSKRRHGHADTTRQRIDRGLFGAAIQLLKVYPAGTGYHSAWWMCAAARLGYLFNDAFLLDRSDRLFQTFVYNSHSFDGMWCGGSIGRLLRVQDRIRSYATLGQRLGRNVFTEHPRVKHILSAWTEMIPINRRIPSFDDSPADGPVVRQQQEQALVHACRWYDDADLAARLTALAGPARAAQVFPGQDAWLPPTVLQKKLPAATGRPALPRTANRPGLGMAVLRGGRFGRMIELFFDYGHTNGHQHPDLMNVILYHNGIELVSDVGCAKVDFPRPPTDPIAQPWGQVHWGANSGSHNLVQVDGKPQVGGYGCLQGFYTGPYCQWVDADARRAYQQHWDLALGAYRRTLAVVTTPLGSAYVVDMFRVQGGRQHDYLIHARSPQVELQGVPLKRLGTTLLQHDHPIYTQYGDHLTLTGLATVDPDVMVRNTYQTAWKRNRLIGNGYGFLEGLQKGTMSGSVARVRWTRQHEGRPVHLDLHVVPQRDLHSTETCFLARGMDVTGPSRGLRSRRAAFVYRRVGDPGLASTFLSVLESHDRLGAQVQNVARLLPWGFRPKGEAAVIVRIGKFEDIIIHWPEGTTQPVKYRTQSGELVELDGCYGFVRRIGKTPICLEVSAGRGLCYDQFRFSVRSALHGEVVEVRGDPMGRRGPSAMVVDARGPVATGRTLGGRTLLVRRADGSTTGYPIEQVRAGNAPGRYEIVLAGSPGFVLNASRIRHVYPHERLVRTEDRHAKSATDQFFVGKRLRIVRTGRTYTIERLVRALPWASDRIVLREKFGKDIQTGDRYQILSVDKGDQVVLPSYLRIGYAKAQRQALEASGDVRITTPWGKRRKLSFQNAEGKMVPAPTDRMSGVYMIPLAQMRNGHTELEWGPYVAPRRDVKPWQRKGRAKGARTRPHRKRWDRRRGKDRRRRPVDGGARPKQPESRKPDVPRPGT